MLSALPNWSAVIGAAQVAGAICHGQFDAPVMLSHCTDALRLGCSGVPCELVQHWDAGQPLLVGGLSPAEEGRTFLQLRLKRHRWSPKVLKARDPLTFSIGWRRFQSLPVFAIEDANGRLRWVATLTCSSLACICRTCAAATQLCTCACLSSAYKHLCGCVLACWLLL